MQARPEYRGKQREESSDRVKDDQRDAFIWLLLYSGFVFFYASSDEITVIKSEFEITLQKSEG